MYLDDATYEYIKGEVAYLYKQQGICSFPICASQLAVQMGFGIIPYSSLDLIAYAEAVNTSPDGFYAERNWQEYIFVNDVDPSIGKDRRDMTIFHEIGHAVLGHDDSVLDDDTKEAAAKFFGKYLAAPPSLIHLITPQSEYDIQNRFGISETAAGIAKEYYEKWKIKVKRYGLANYDIIILNQFGISKFNQLKEYIKSIKEDTEYEGYKLRKICSSLTTNYR